MTTTTGRGAACSGLRLEEMAIAESPPGPACFGLQTPSVGGRACQRKDENAARETASPDSHSCSAPRAAEEPRHHTALLDAALAQPFMLAPWTTR